MTRSRLTTIIAAAAVLALGGLAGCKKSSSDTTVSVKPAPQRTGGSTVRSPRATEAAQGDVREALLQLERVHFGYDTATILPAARDSLERAARLLAGHTDVHIYVEGHTDERGTTEYNVALGERRAAAVVDYLVRMGIDRGRLHPVSYGKERPLRDGKGVLAYAVNRRAEFRLLRGDIELVLEGGTPFDDTGRPLVAAGTP
ncbi:MAG: OmpA family protein [Myxococcales bacterium]|nr:OmpA family protein [Myxococcales bacterium]